MEAKNTLKLNKENVLKLWSKTYNTEGKPDWSHIFPYYSDDIVFQDSIQKIEGKQDFIEMCKRLTKRSKQLQMNIQSITQTKNIIMLDWEMVMIFRRSPSTPIYGATKLEINDENQIVNQRDYYDLWGDIYNGIPGFRRLYRWFMRKLFG